MSESSETKHLHRRSVKIDCLFEDLIFGIASVCEGKLKCREGCVFCVAKQITKKHTLGKQTKLYRRLCCTFACRAWFEYFWIYTWNLESPIFMHLMFLQSEPLGVPALIGCCLVIGSDSISKLKPKFLYWTAVTKVYSFWSSKAILGAREANRV